VLKWPVDVDDQPHTIGGGKVVHVACQDDDPRVVTVWTIEPRPGTNQWPNSTREVQIFGTGHPLPLFATHVGTALTMRGTLVWHCFELPPVPDEES
jgi:hypothetical protein